MENSAITYIDDYTNARSKTGPTVMADNPPSVDELFNDHHHAVYQAAFRVTGNAQDAEDVLQTVFLRLLKRSDDDVNVGDDPARYLCRAAINAGLDILRSKKRNQTVELEDWQQSSEHASPIANPTPPVDIDVKQSQLRRQLRAAIAQLHPRAAEMFVLRYFEDFSNAEVAKLMNTSPSSIAVTLHRTRDRLQEYLRDFGDQML